MGLVATSPQEERKKQKMSTELALNYKTAVNACIFHTLYYTITTTTATRDAPIRHWPIIGRPTIGA